MTSMDKDYDVIEYRILLRHTSFCVTDIFLEEPLESMMIDPMYLVGFVVLLNALHQSFVNFKVTSLL